MHLFKPTPYERHQWKWQKMTNTAAVEAEQHGRKTIAEDFGEFAEDVFHRFVAEQPAKADPQPAGADVWAKLHGQMDVLPEVADLRDRCVGDEIYAGIATAAMLDTLTATVPAVPGGPLGDAEADTETLEALRRLMARRPAEETPAIQEVADEVEESFQVKLTRAAGAADMIDETDVRGGLRKAAEAASKAIAEYDRMADGLGCGQGQHGGRAARHALAAKVAPLLKNNQRLANIMRLAGRLRRIALAEQARKPHKGVEEVTGVETGDDLGRVLPSEMAFYLNGSLQPIFLGRLANQALQQLELEDRPPENQGPIVCLLDSSGSMSHNQADEWAAAVCMAFLEVATRQKRGFALVHFGGAVLRIDRFPAAATVDPEKLVKAVTYFAADGGTNFTAALDAGLAELKAMPKADIVMITDGYSSVTPSTLADVNRRRADEGLHVYSILIGTEPQGSVNQQFSDQVVELGAVLRDDSNMHALFGAV